MDIKDPNFRSISRQMQLESSVNSSAEIAKAAMELIDRNWRYSEPIRLITVTGINISVGMPEEQISLFEPAIEETLGHDLGSSYQESEEEEIEYEER